MYRTQILGWLKETGQPHRVSGDEIICKCPFGTHSDSNPSFSVNTKTGLCHCFSCGEGSHINKIMGVQQDSDSIRYSKYSYLTSLWEKEEEIEETTITLPPVDFFINESIRGIPAKLLQDLGVYYCSHGRYKGRLIFPIRDTYGSVLGFDARIYEHPNRLDITPNVPEAKYLRPTNMKTANVLYPIDYLYNSDLDVTTVVLTEGIFDAISYIALGQAAVCNFGLGLPSPTKVGLLLSLGTEYISNGLDSDLPAIKAWQGDPDKNKEGLKHAWASNLLIGKPTEITKAIRASNYKDANEFIQSLKEV